MANERIFHELLLQHLIDPDVKLDSYKYNTRDQMTLQLTFEYKDP